MQRHYHRSNQDDAPVSVLGSVPGFGPKPNPICHYREPSLNFSSGSLLLATYLLCKSLYRNISSAIVCLGSSQFGSVFWLVFWFVSTFYLTKPTNLAANLSPCPFVSLYIYVCYNTSIFPFRFPHRSGIKLVVLGFTRRCWRCQVILRLVFRLWARAMAWVYLFISYISRWFGWTFLGWFKQRINGCYIAWHGIMSAGSMPWFEFLCICELFQISRGRYTLMGIKKQTMLPCIALYICNMACFQYVCIWFLGLWGH